MASLVNIDRKSISISIALDDASYVENVLIPRFKLDRSKVFSRLVQEQREKDRRNKARRQSG